jgi:5-methylcytosine-specific restriction enzyme subunit McrC
MTIDRIPVRNLWLLMLYASDLYRSLPAKSSVDVEKNPDDIPDLVAEILTELVERRLRRNLTFGFHRRHATVHRVRGRIDFVTTESRQLLNRGVIACEFDELTANTPRNRYVRAALDHLARMVRTSTHRQRCRSLSRSMSKLGVTGEKPTRNEVNAESYTRHELFDKEIIAAARLVFDLLIPTEETGSSYLVSPQTGIFWIRQLYEKAVAGFYQHILPRSEWTVATGSRLYWNIQSQTDRIADILPHMKADIILHHKTDARRIVVDAKFTQILTTGWYRDETLKNAYLYQIYAYLRSQESEQDPPSQHAIGILLHPAVEQDLWEEVVIQGHPIHFVTVNLAGDPSEFRDRLLACIAQTT